MGKRVAMLLVVVLAWAHAGAPTRAEAPAQRPPNRELRKTDPDLPRLRRFVRNEPRTTRTDDQRVVVRFRKGANRDSALRAADASTDESIQELDVEVVRSDQDASSLAAELRADDRVASAEPVGLRYASKIPNDPGFSSQGHLIFGRFPLAWEIKMGSPSLDIAILDTGVDLDHPDLAGRIVAGRDTVNEDATAQDDDGHGTIVAGVAGAITNNSRGIAGAAWNARIMPVKVLDSDGSGNDFDIAQGIVWATDHGAEVINMSFGGTGTSTVLEDAVAYAISKEVIVVAAAGNESSSVPSYPAASPGVIGVGATDLNGDYVSFSNYGPWVDVFAPGTQIVSTALGTEEAYVSDAAGTSFSSPIVAGMAGLVRTANPSATPAVVESWLKHTAVDRSALVPGTYGWLDAYASLGGRPAAQPAEPYTGASGLRSDFNGDGYDDAVIGAPTEDVGSIKDAGAVQVFYGSSTGPKTTGSLMITQNTKGVSGSAEAGDQFGFAVATGDVNRDGYDDLAVGAPFEDVGSVRDGGVVHVFLGSAGGLRMTGSQAWTQGSNGAAGKAERNDLFGYAVSFGDYDGFPGDDLAVGAPGESDGPTPSVGAVTILSGRSGGVTGAGSIQWVQQPKRAGNLYGFSLASGDVDSDTNDELIVGAPGTDGSKVDAGAVEVLHGTVLGLRRDFTLTPDFIWGESQSEYFGFSVAIGDLMTYDGNPAGDHYDDIAIGAPGADSWAGRVDVIASDWSGILAGFNYLQQGDGTGDTAEAGDSFGWSLAATRCGSCALVDLLIGVPGEDVGSLKDAGVFHSQSVENWLIPTAALSQNSPGIPGSAEAGDRFGTTVAYGRFRGASSLANMIGAPDEGIGAKSRAGHVAIYYGAGVGSSMHQGAGGVPGMAETGDRFGAALGGSN
ncbi:MAG: S8 family serine peptidase [Actinomycetota bacterium]